ncbi:CpaF family protein [Vibrio casei]|uniref:CpaF family protein n=1 Tax=Vibrio casei TaxID=673372 RepID=A0A368LFY4_9VIBR|nr:CpaF family protein [Vibrio casei]RCS68355.1 CpaF family protein [Vibrio casei]SJN22775.1 Type II/IV secretion system ATP hydrolase TadA/VirB11/CpaF, TadA subfamily [Vibrio casei]
MDDITASSLNNRDIEFIESLTFKSHLHQYVLECMEDDGVIFDASMKDKANILLPVNTYIQQYLESHLLPPNLTIDDLADQLVDEMIGYGPIECLLNDDTVDDILINGPRRVYVERFGCLEKVDHQFLNDEHIIRVIRRMLAPLGRRVDESNPMVDARLPDGSRINAIIPPLALDGACLSIRKFKQDILTGEYLLEKSSISEEMLTFLRQAVRARFNVLISGATGSGKTTLLNILSQAIQNHERVVTIEDAAELQLRNGHVVRLETRPPNAEGKGEVSARELLKNALRMRPDRIILGESRGGEVLDMLQAMNTGHLGSMSTLHANSPSDALIRLEMMVTLAGFHSSETFIRKVVASALDVIIQISRQPNGKRVITDIVEVSKIDGDKISTHSIYHYDSMSHSFKHVGQLSERLQQQLEETP